MSKETLGFLLAIGSFVVFLALYLIDKSGKPLPPYVIGGLLVLLAGMAIWGILLLPWFWNSRSLAETVWRAIFGVAVTVLLIARFGIWVWPNVEAPHVAQPAVPSTPEDSEQPPTMATLFTQDLPTTLKYTNDLSIQLSDGTSMVLKQQIYIDFDARTKFVGFYIPSSGRNPEKTYVVAMRLVNQVDAAFSHMNKNATVQGGYRGEREDARDLPFSGRVLLYHEDFLSIPQKADIIRLYEAKHYNVQFRGPDYLGDQIVSWHHQHDKK